MCRVVRKFTQYYTIKVENRVPIIGEIQNGYKLGKEDKHWYIYAACIDCGKERWSQLKSKDRKETYLRCHICSLHARKGCVSPFKGRTHTAEAKLQNSLKHKGKILTEEHKFKASQSVKAFYKLHPEIWDRLHKNNIGKKRTPQYKAESSLRNKGKIITKEQKIKISKSLKEYYKLHPEQREIIHKRNYGRRHTLEELDRTVRGIIKASHMKPNRCEIKLGELINRVSSDFKYNGGGELGVVLGGRIPDYVNVNGKKQVINFNGCHWHGCSICYPQKYIENDTRNNIKPYIGLGYKVLVIWEHELLDEENVVNKIRDFCGAKRIGTK